MVRRRRRTIDRNPINRVIMWDSKLEPETYGRYLVLTKEIARRAFTRYQFIHEELIRIVKQVLSKYPSEVAREHAYMWFAQGIWYITQRYSDKALQKEADALFTYFLFLGLREDALREIAEKLGVKISDYDTLLDPVAMPVSNIVKRVIDELLIERRVYDILERSEYIPAYIEPYSGKVEVSEVVEYTLIDTTKIVDTPIIHIVEGFVDATKSNTDLVFTYYVKVHEESNYIPYYSVTVSQADLQNAVYIMSRPSYYGVKITIKPATTPSSPYLVYYSFFIRKIK